MDYKHLAYVFVAVVLISISSIVKGDVLIPEYSSSTIPHSRETEHFQIYFDGIFVSDIQPILVALEDSYGTIMGDLRPDAMPKVRVKIWRSKKAFYGAMKSNLGVTYAGADGYVNGPHELHIRLIKNAPVYAVHEFAHVVTLNVNRYFSNNPRWLWEAVALYEAGQFVDPKRLSYMTQGDYPDIFSAPRPARAKLRLKART